MESLEHLKQFKEDHMEQKEFRDILAKDPIAFIGEMYLGTSDSIDALLYWSQIETAFRKSKKSFEDRHPYLEE